MRQTGRKKMRNPRLITTVFYLVSFSIIAVFLQQCNRANSNSVVSWGKPTLIVPDVKIEDDIVSPIGVDGSGNAILVSLQAAGKGKSIWVKRYGSKKGWQSATRIGEESADILNPQITMNSLGNAIVVWERFNDGQTRIYANRYETSIGWEKAVSIQTIQEDASSPQVVMDILGNGMAVWEQSDGKGRNIYANSYDLKKGWGSAKLISMKTGHAFGPKIAMDKLGNAMTVWYQSDGTDYQVWTNRYGVEKGWGTATQIHSTSVDILHPQIAVDEIGNAILVWRQFDGIEYSLYASRLVIGTGWEKVTLIETHKDDAIYHRIAIDRAGNAIVVWVQRRCIERRCIFSNIWTNRYKVNMGWETPRQLAESGSDPRVAMDGYGNIILVWDQLEGIFNKAWRIKIYWYKFSEGWKNGVGYSAGTLNAFHPTLSMNVNGDALIAWEEIGEDTRDIWANWVAVPGEGN